MLPPNFTVYRKDCPTRAGGVVLAIDTCIFSRLLTSPDLEVVTVEIQTSNPCIICLLYNPPNSGKEYHDQLISYLSILMQGVDPVVILGDFNIPDISWSSFDANSQFSSKICDLIFQHNHSQLIEYPTHRQGNILDLIITNYDENIANLQIHTEDNPLLTSDHFPVTFYLSLPHNCTDATDNNSINLLHYSKADFDSINEYVSHVDFSSCFHSSDVEYVW